MAELGFDVCGGCTASTLCLCHEFRNLPKMTTSVHRCLGSNNTIIEQWHWLEIFSRVSTEAAPSQNSSSKGGGGPTPSVGARPTTRALHPRTATAAHKRGARARIKGRPRGLGLGPANGWAALSKRFGGYPNSAPTGGAALPG